MNTPLDKFRKLYDRFSSFGFSLYLVGGTVRDYLLGIPLGDMDAVTDATPNEMKSFLPEANYSFERFGSISIKIDGTKFDITTLRKEGSYLDSRHPLKIIFVKDLKEDVQRRDFTINALYLDKNLKVIDYVDGLNDIDNRVLRMVGNPKNRLKDERIDIKLIAV